MLWMRNLRRRPASGLHELESASAEYVEEWDMNAKDIHPMTLCE